MYKFTNSKEKINDLMYMDGVKIFAKINKKGEKAWNPYNLVDSIVKI